MDKTNKNKTWWLGCEIKTDENVTKLINFTSIKVFYPYTAYIDGFGKQPDIVTQNVLLRIAVSMMFKFYAKDEIRFKLHTAIIDEYNRLVNKYFDKISSELPF